ncbi:receptor-like kinase TMK4 isoform X2 [Humulus lupulus]|uniref:receptor-like kinase TMK4 isoform X2 n=1 Tax=Humulus lupulus TaxID=3486 RepID=UPI002B403177|nr:receptor-like kinase TMK4 isoform X2 [Humulus lupulus]
MMSSLLEAISPAPIGWSHSAHYCSKWKGVKCSSSGRVSAINLAHHNLTGTLPSNLASLSELNSFNLKGNRFSGPLPSFADLSLLEEIFLDYNNFTSVPPRCFQGLTSLMVLTMNQNINLDRWVFPIELTDSPSLVNISLVNCNVKGPIPDIFGFGSFPKLYGLTLSHNNLSGVLPPSFAESGIQYLMLDTNKLIGTIGVVSNMTKLSQVWLSGNNFTGPIPDLSKLDTLFNINLQDNKLTGVVPRSLISIPSLRNVSLANNLLQGPLPSFPYVAKPNLGENSFCMDTPGPCNWQVAVLLEVAGDLGYPLSLASSWRGNDACEGWISVGCDLHRNVVNVTFQKRGFTGRISPAFSNLTQLQNLWLNDNNLTGPIPESLTHLHSLQLLNVSHNNLSGTIPTFQLTVNLITTGNPLLKNHTSSSLEHNGTSTNGGESNNDPVKAATGKGREFKVIVAIAAIGLIMIMMLFCQRKFPIKKLNFFWKKQNPAHRNIETFLRNCGPLQVRRYSYSEVKKMTNSFKEKLGQGGFGSVYKGKLHDGSLIAVKVLNESKTTNGEDFINEVATISRTSHVNIVSLLGFCFEGAKKALIYEFLVNGSLEKFVFEEDATENNHKLDWETHYQISLGIARGLEYLHRGCNTRILHFDIKPHNILLDAEFVPKISDFGLAKICSRQESLSSMLGPRGTIGYIAPEIFSRNFGVISYKSDVYSYGMMVLEIVGGRQNVNVQANNTSEIYFPHWVYRRLELDEEVSLKRISDEEDKTKVKKMIIVSLWCVQADPANRPTMSKVIEMLEGSVDSLQVPPSPFLSSCSTSLPAEFSSSIVFSPK